jgi:hypothetical protein
LQWLSTARSDNSKLERWAMRLQEIDFTVEYLPGEQNAVADHLSRHFPHVHATSVPAVAGHFAYATAVKVCDVVAAGGDVLTDCDNKSLKRRIHRKAANLRVHPTLSGWYISRVQLRSGERCGSLFRPCLIAGLLLQSITIA